MIISHARTLLVKKEKKKRQWLCQVYSRFFVQQSESLFWYFEFLRQSPFQSLNCLFQGQGELEACAGGGVDVQIHGGLSRDGLAGRSPAAGAAPGAGMLVHPITCGQRWGRQDEQSRE